MKRVIIAFVMTMFGFAANTAQAEIVSTTQSYENVYKYTVKSIPDATTDEIEMCYNAVKSGGEYQIKRKRIMIKCAEEEMVVFRRLFF